MINVTLFGIYCKGRILCFIPDNSANVSQLLSHIAQKIEAVNDPLPDLGTILGKWYLQLFNKLYLL